MPETALAAARAADADIARGHYEGVLHGVPIGVKDLLRSTPRPRPAPPSFVTFARHTTRRLSRGCARPAR